EPQPDYEQGGSQVRLGRAWPNLGVGEQAECRHRNAGHGDAASSDLVGQPARDRKRQGGTDSLRGQKQAGVQRHFVAYYLVVKRDQDQRAEQADHQQQVQSCGGGKAAAAQQRDVDQGGSSRGVPNGGVPEVQADQREPGQRRDASAQACEADASGLRHAVQKDRYAGREQ